MLCALLILMSRYQVSVYRTNGPLVSLPTGISFILVVYSLEKNACLM